LTDDQFRALLDRLEKTTGVDVLTAPKVITVSGRQAKMDLLEDRPIVVSKSLLDQPDALPATVREEPSEGTRSDPFAIKKVGIGPTVDVLPTVLADGFSIEITAKPTIISFLGYDDPGPYLPQAQGVAGNTVGTPLAAVLPRPRFRILTTTASATLSDGQTMLIAGIPELAFEDVQLVKDKVPVLGDIPLLGRLFRNENRTAAKKSILVFVTPTLIDPAGNPVHPK